MAEITFEPLRQDQLVMLRGWLVAPHVARWWGAPPDAGAVEAEYLPAITGAEPTWHYIVRVNRHAIGMVQWYFWSDHPNSEDGEIGARPDEAGLDYLIGEAKLTGRGLGGRMLAPFLEQVVFANRRVIGVRSTVHVDNLPSWRCLEKLGFYRGDPIPHPKGNLQYVLTLPRP